MANYNWNYGIADTGSISGIQSDIIWIRTRGQETAPFSVETQGYQITDQYYAMAASESYMVWNISADIGYIDVMFEQPVSGNTVVIAYTGSGGEKSFDRFRRIERYMMDGTEMTSIPGGPHIWLVFVLIYLYVLNAWVYHGMFSSSIARSLQIILPIAACSFLSFLSALAIDHTVMPVLDYVIEAVCRGKRKRDS